MNNHELIRDTPEQLQCAFCRALVDSEDAYIAGNDVFCSQACAEEAQQEK